MSNIDKYFVVRGHNKGRVEIDPDEIEGECVSGMSVYAAPSEQAAVDYLRVKRPGSSYGVTHISDLKRLRNFKIREAFEGGNQGHYLIDGITIKEARNKFSTIGKL